MTASETLKSVLRKTWREDGERREGVGGWGCGDLEGGR
jgi:hypothetical protein